MNGRVLNQKQIMGVFDDYQRARTQFVQTIAELSSRKKNIDLLQQAGVMPLLRPMLLDVVPTIQQTAALALGRLANHDEKLAKAIVEGDILPQLVYSLDTQNSFYKKAAAFVLRAVSRHNAELAQNVVDCGGVNALVSCLDSMDIGVREAAAWGLGYVARHNAKLAQQVVDAGATPLLIFCLREPEISLKRIAASALADIAKHGPELAQTIVDAGAIAHLAKLILNADARLKRQVYSALCQICKHSVELAEMVVEAEIFPPILVSLKDADDAVVKNCAWLMREIVKHTPELAQLVVNAGGVAACVDYVSEKRGHITVPGIMMLGYVASHSEHLATSVIIAKGVQVLASVLSGAEEDDFVKAAAAWAVGQIGRHSSEHAKAVAMVNILPNLLRCLKDSAYDDLVQKSKKALKATLQKCVYLPALQSLLKEAPPNILKYVVFQFSKVLPHDARARREFVTSDGLQFIQTIAAEPNTTMYEAIQAINNCFPQEIVRYFSPGYSEQLLEKVEQYQPLLPEDGDEEGGGGGGHGHHAAQMVDDD